jgi:hypothetical protein
MQQLAASGCPLAGGSQWRGRPHEFAFFFAILRKKTSTQNSVNFSSAQEFLVLLTGSHPFQAKHIFALLFEGHSTAAVGRVFTYSARLTHCNDDPVRWFL